jgi:predicted nucleotidyltransferase
MASKVEELGHKLGARWTNLAAARQLADEKKAVLRDALSTFDSEDTSIVVAGSLARGEFTAGSDIDWSLLIDGSADPGHYNVAEQVAGIVASMASKPVGAEGTFGKMVFSHDLIHDIGGEDDTNRNTTRRLLLLLETAAVGRDDAHRRVVKHILSRYLMEDRGFWTGAEFRVPRFLQNDFARYWRTMAVDFAYKLRKRRGDGWAIRNLKLRMSRKLIYIAALLACFRCHMDHTEEQWNVLRADPSRRPAIVDYLEQIFRETPLDIAAGVLLRFDRLNPTARKIFGAYDEFVGILADDRQRDSLDNLQEQDAATHPVYQRARMLSHEFRDGLLEFFFDRESGMEKLTQNYGVF